MVYFGNETSLKRKLMEYDKESLKRYAQDIEIKGAYKMKKEELADCIYAYLLTPEVMFYRMAILSDKDIKFFEEGCGKVAQIDPRELDYDSIGRLNEMDLICVSRDQFFTPDDVAEVWKQINDDKFKAYRKRASWVWRCLHFAEEFYGYTPVECLLDVVNTKKGMRMKEEELYDIFEHFPMDQLWTVRINDIFLASKYVHDMDLLEELRRSQMGKDHYIPTVDEVEEFYEDCALISDHRYQKLMKFMEEDMGLSHEDAYDITWELFDRIAFEDDSHGTMQWLWDQFTFADDKQVEKIVNLYMPIANNTRMRANRGFKPTELHSKTPMTEMPTIVAGSSLAASMLQQAAPQLQQMGFGLDLESNAGRIPVMTMPNGINGGAIVSEKKVYPNDPCPCGSGKKYKKCCGKKC